MEWNLFFTIIGSTATLIGVIYAVSRNARIDFNKKFEVQERKFEAFDNRILALDNRIFQVAMGKSLKDILLEERTKKKAKGE